MMFSEMCSMKTGLLFLFSYHFILEKKNEYEYSPLNMAYMCGLVIYTNKQSLVRPLEETQIPLGKDIRLMQSSPLW